MTCETPYLIDTQLKHEEKIENDKEYILALFYCTLSFPELWFRSLDNFPHVFQSTKFWIMVVCWVRVQRVGFGQNRFQQYDGPTQKSHHMHHIQFQTNFPNAQFTDISTLDILQRLPLLLHKLDIIYKKNPIRDQACWHNLRRFLAANLTQNNFLLSFLVAFATKVPYLTFCVKMWQILM